MTLRFFQVNAFTGPGLLGNPAGVVIAPLPIPAELMQQIAGRGNLPEIAFITPSDGVASIRWFSPVAEVDLCGHATLAAAHVLFTHLGWPDDSIRFPYAGGTLNVLREGGHLAMALPLRTPAPTQAPAPLLAALGTRPREVLLASDYLVVYEHEAEVRGLCPDIRALSSVAARGVIVTAPGDEVDFVSRFFAPALGIDEDHVTGSAHCTLAPYWGARLQKSRLQARQVSPRGGELACELTDDAVILRGEAQTWLEGTLA